MVLKLIIEVFKSMQQILNQIMFTFLLHTFRQLCLVWSTDFGSVLYCNATMTWT